jgi:hypothetical protein
MDAHTEMPGDQLTGELARVNKLLSDYTDLGATGQLAADRLRKTLARAETAQHSGDAVAIYNAIQELQGCT